MNPEPIPPRLPPKPFPFLTILLSILVVLSLTSSVYLAYQNIQLQKQIADLQNIPIPSPTHVVDPTANWKTFTHNKLEFSIKYPSEWSLKEDPKFVEFDSHLPSEKKLMDSDKNTTYKLNVSVDPQTNFNEWTNYESTTKLESQKIGSFLFERYIAADLYYSLNFILKQEEKIFRFMIYPYDESVLPKELSSNIENLLSTFTLLNTITPSCTPRPACLDATPRCLIPETEDMCPPEIKTGSYTCPSNGWVDCMPGTTAKPECSSEAMAWYKTNCPNFQGGAY